MISLPSSAIQHGHVVRQSGLLWLSKEQTSIELSDEFGVRGALGGVFSGLEKGPVRAADRCSTCRDLLSPKGAVIAGSSLQDAFVKVRDKILH
jgi:hypothetical protein